MPARGSAIRPPDEAPLLAPARKPEPTCHATMRDSDAARSQAAARLHDMRRVIRALITRHKVPSMSRGRDSAAARLHELVPHMARAHVLAALKRHCYNEEAAMGQWRPPLLTPNPPP
jgi:hypothetical protein